MSHLDRRLQRASGDLREAVAAVEVPASEAVGRRSVIRRVVAAATALALVVAVSIGLVLALRPDGGEMAGPSSVCPSALTPKSATRTSPGKLGGQASASMMRHRARCRAGRFALMWFSGGLCLKRYRRSVE